MLLYGDQPFPAKLDPAAPTAWAAAPNAVVVGRWDFSVRGRALAVAIDPSKARTTQPGVEYADPGTMTTYIVGSAYRIAPLELDRVATTVSAGAVEDITFTLSDDAPSSWFVQASTGVIYGQFDAPGDYEFQVLVVDKAGQSDVLEALLFAVVEQQDFTRQGRFAGQHVPAR